MKKIKYVCKYCNSEDIVWDAFVNWNFKLQKMEISQEFDWCFCNTCEGDTRPIKIEVKND